MRPLGSRDSFDYRDPSFLAPEMSCRTGCLPHLLRCACILFILTSPALAADFTGKVVGVSDGDTITVLHSGKADRTGLHGIDRPEKRQPFSQRAKSSCPRLWADRGCGVALRS